MLALKILQERLVDLERIMKMYQSTQVQNDILETKTAISELEELREPESRIKNLEEIIKILKEEYYEV